jgi:hypothetical protein
MTPAQNNNIRDIKLTTNNDALVATLAAQYAHMDKHEARTSLEKLHEPVWDNDELLDVFEVSHFEPPLVHVIRKTDGVRGTVVFIDSPRLYFSFHAEEKKNEQRSPQGV